MRVSKYKAKRTKIGDLVFASRGEAERYRELSFLEGIGSISDLILQPKFALVSYGKFICNYVADFQYKEDGKTIVEDFKGFKTPTYRIKKKLFEANYDDIFIHRETSRKD
jgi:hypothetical protein